MEPTEEQTYREFVRSMLTDIKVQTTKTNGRVSALEDRQDADDVRYAFLRGAMWVLGILMTAIVLPLAFIAIQYAIGA